METREGRLSERRANAERKKRQYASEEGIKKHKEAVARSKRKIALEQQMLHEELSLLQNKVEHLEQKLARKKQKFQLSKDQITIMDEELSSQHELDADRLADGDDDVPDGDHFLHDKSSREFVDSLIANDSRLKRFTRMERKEFETLVAECSDAIYNTTTRGSPRVNHSSRLLIPYSHMVFMTLFFLHQYPTLSFMSTLFLLHEREVTRILKRSLSAMASVLEKDIQWPSDHEFEEMKKNFCYLQNFDFTDCVCIVDGTEIRVSRPVGWEAQKALWSGKKHQHSLNVMVITLLNGIIVYCSKARIGAHDQAHWNDLHLRELFVGKSFGIGGDGGFTFNRKKDSDTEKIIGYKPFCARKSTPLTDEQKKYNKKFSEMRVIVENTIGRMKQWNVLKGVFRHFRGERHQLSVDHILQVVAALTNRQTREHPLRSAKWLASDWLEWIP